MLKAEERNEADITNKSFLNIEGRDVVMISFVLLLWWAKYGEIFL